MGRALSHYLAEHEHSDATVSLLAVNVQQANTKLKELVKDRRDWYLSRC